MKRVLNSGSIKLPYITGTEEGLRANLNNNWTPEIFAEKVCSVWPEELDKVLFTFEVKAPLLTFNDFQEAQLGTLTRLPVQDYQIAYLPPKFYSKSEGLMFNIMTNKACNDQNTKLYNFYVGVFNLYNNLLKEGMCKEQARLVLPQGLFIVFQWSITAQDLIRFINEHHSESPEIWGYCSTFVLYLEEHLPLVTKWLKTNRWQNFSL